MFVARFLAILVHLGQDLAVFGKFRHFRHFWQIWPFLAHLGNFGNFGQISEIVADKALVKPVWVEQQHG